MKHLLILIICLFTLGMTNPPDDNLYFADLTEITVKANILEGFKAKRYRTLKEVRIKNKPMFVYVSKHTILTEAQVYALFVMEQGKGSYLFTKHNNPFNVKGKGVEALTWEYTPDNKVLDNFKSHPTIQEGIVAFVEYFNRRFSHIKAGSNEEVFYQMRFGKDKRGNTIAYHTDYSHYTRANIANKYETTMGV